MDAGTWTTEGAGNTPAPILGTGRVRAPNAGVYCTAEAVCIVEEVSGVTALPPAAAADCRSAAGIGVSGAEVPDTASGVLVAAGSMSDLPAPLDVAMTLLGPEVAVGELLEAAAGTLDVVGILVELPVSVDTTSEVVMPVCATSVVMVV
ncbi:hypothetical protein PF005_g20353 [Phytophthora fragariae]|uniref:Uncharacterized protein n=1 Tax=Phytophthora fragariae TaxID=53985 RepID=A0A6A3ECX2_9STRA|nr:hypothetical protein PF009_g20239 [Phytophthora fragariae]KAE8968817.1 hypothetical protein PF011_g27043 [Phytophthora fragariae]KAE9088729.1 hypothetical protein PF010_g19274 [Phytophthora fragariae]KAE9091861.1 hypothetical protein PF007_g18732 [Phytophthora fragariae]KAE9118068.1 hypothetical protein PF006_g18680 [Phytophthora fragariae]